MRFFVLKIFFFLQLISFSQNEVYNIEAKYPVSQLQDDIDYLEKYLTKLHPAPYRYIKKDSLHRFIQAIKSKIDEPLTELQFRFYLRQIIQKIGCGHTGVSASKVYKKYVEKNGRPVLPINTIITADKNVFIYNNLSQDSSLKTGEKIIAINKHPTPEILDKMNSICTSDGYNETHKNQTIQLKQFKYYYSACYGYSSTYSIEIKHQDGSVSEHTVNSVSSLQDTSILLKTKPIDLIYKTKFCNFYLDKENKDLAIIDISNFDGKNWRRFQKKTFRYIRKNKIRNVAIDLRGNGGGSCAKGINLLSYLLRRPVAVGFDRKPNLLPFNRALKLGFWGRITPIMFLTIPTSLPRHWHLRHYFIWTPKIRNAYHGNLFVLTNGFSFSMSAITTSYLKYKAKATIIGEETGGNVKECSGMCKGDLVLPFSKITITIPLYRVYCSVKAIDTGHGVMPDHPTNYSLEDILTEKDLDLEKVRELIKANSLK